MLTEVKNQLKVMVLSVKYNIMREMTNQVTFVTNILFMMLNNAIFIVQWLLLFHLRDNIGGYKVGDVLVLWGLAASTFGFANIFFRKAFDLPDLIMNGKLDSFLVQPKNVLLGVIISGTSTSAIGDLLYGFVILCVFKFSILNVILFTVLTISGGIILTSFAVITGSLSFWIVKGDLLSGNLIGVMINMSTYPDGIFKGVVRLMLYSVIPIGLTVYLPVKIIIHFQFKQLLMVLAFAVGIICLAYYIFYKGLRRYSSSNLMSARV
ncbi:ABC-2 family transporter protein [Anaerocolumna sp. AGMB13025]|uniref:ABC transporter permease n=1 Tax=Anaerocolumna sp. AGMB13025 TaxID=3039116 RepID=UPI00241D821F|nr:ABC-2 family transporter protein [Anaerocolumna sp. AGMB13025]WFR58737.1 ABC-2 family transporter protein [Anaerocolumna sp. AGMB13025]